LRKRHANNAVIGGNAFITSSVGANTRVSMKNLEMDYVSTDKKHKTEEITQSEEWYYII
jgi:serine O-acetyltransferase